jgi:predicted phosphate transport protein (TIGR00153 family)
MIRWIKSISHRNIVFDLIEGHLKIVREMVDQMANICEPMQRMDWQELDRIRGVMNVLENEADEVQRSIIEKISEGSYFGGIFSELIQLINKIDDIADTAKDAMATLTQERPDKTTVECLTRTNDLVQFVCRCRDTVYALDFAVKGLSINRQTASERTYEIKKVEEDADTYKSRLLRSLFSKSENRDTLGIIQLENFINITDQIADNAKDAGDLIFVLIIRGYG